MSPPESERIAVRLATLDDLAAAAVLGAAATNDTIVTAEGMRTWLADTPPEGHLLLMAAEIDGEMVGWCTASKNWTGAEPDTGTVEVVVRIDQRRRGVGRELTARALAHLEGVGVTRVQATSPDGTAQQGLARAFDFVQTHSQNGSSVDPRAVAAQPLPHGVTLLAFGEIDDPAPLHALDLEVSRDLPGSYGTDGITLERWTANVWRSLSADDDTSLAVYVDGELAGMTMLQIDRPSGRAQNHLTGVRRPYRGRGLAKLLKSHSLHRAGLAGATVAFTFNDETNAAMMKVNQSLGYRVVSRWIEWERRSNPS